MTTINLTQPFLSFTEFEKFINDDIVVDTIYKVSNFYFETIKIEKEKSDDEPDEMVYCWTLNKNFYVAGSTGYIFPMQSANYVKTFKTLEGCKKNLLAKLSNWDHIWTATNKYISKRTPADDIKQMIEINRVEKVKMLKDYESKIQKHLDFMQQQSETFERWYNELTLSLNSNGIKITKIFKVDKSGNNIMKPTGTPTWEVFDNESEFVVRAEIEVSRVRTNLITVNQFLNKVRTDVLNSTDCLIGFASNQYSLQGKKTIECSFWLHNEKSRNEAKGRMENKK